MPFDFFTFGGGHFWEDVFFYQKWRIQRNYESKKYRLLDNWDIRRHQGSFEECRKAFFKYIEVYEISRQKGHMIIMLHGIGESKNIFRNLWREALSEGYMAAAINFPSTQKPTKAHARQIDFLLNNMEDVDKISFVTIGAGDLILRQLMALNGQWQKRLKIGRIVEIAPYYNGSNVLAKLGKSKLFNFILGPMCKDMDPKKAKLIPALSKGIQLGIIMSQTPLQKAVESLSGEKKNLLNVEDTLKLSNAKEITEIKNRKMNFMNNPEIVAAAIKFIREGKF